MGGRMMRGQGLRGVPRGGVRGGLRQTSDTVSGPIVFDFTNGVMPSGATLTRASTGTYVDSAGLVRTAAVDEARFDHAWDGTGFALQGLLVEPARTNKILASDNMAASSIWAIGNVTVVADADTSPSGTLTADKIVPNTAINAHYAQLWWQTNYGYNPIVGQVYCLSAHFKSAGKSWVYFSARQEGANCFFNVEAQEIGSSNAGSINTWLKRLAMGWCRISMSFVATSNSIFDCVHGAWISPDNNIRYAAGNNSDGIFYWGWQLEEGSYPSSYIPNPNLSNVLTRHGDYLNLSIPNGSWNLQAITPSGGFATPFPITVLAEIHQFNWADFVAADAENCLLQIIATRL